MQTASHGIVQLLILIWCILAIIPICMLLLTLTRWRRNTAFLLQPRIGSKYSDAKGSSGRRAAALPVALLCQIGMIATGISSLALDEWATHTVHSAGVSTKLRYGLTQVADRRYDCTSSSIEDASRCFALSGSGGLVLALSVLSILLGLRNLKTLLPCTTSARESHEAGVIWACFSNQAVLLLSSLLAWLVVACLSAGLDVDTSFYLLLASSCMSILGCFRAKVLLESMLPPSAGVLRSQIGIAPGESSLVAPSTASWNEKRRMGSNPSSSTLMVGARTTAVNTPTEGGDSLPTSTTIDLPMELLKGVAGGNHLTSNGQATRSTADVASNLHVAPASIPVASAPIQPHGPPTHESDMPHLTGKTPVALPSNETNSPLSIGNVNVGSEIFALQE